MIKKKTTKCKNRQKKKIKKLFKIKFLKIKIMTKTKKLIQSRKSNRLPQVLQKVLKNLIEREIIENYLNRIHLKNNPLKNKAQDKSLNPNGPQIKPVIPTKHKNFNPLRDGMKRLNNNSPRSPKSNLRLMISRVSQLIK